MMRLTFFFVLILVLSISGCATSPMGLEKVEYRSSVEVDVPYQLALKRIVAFDRECAPTQLVPLGQIINDVEHYPDLREAKIVKGASGIGTQIYQVIELREITATSARISLYSKMSRDKFLNRLERWASGNATCDLG